MVREYVMIKRHWRRFIRSGDYPVCNYCGRLLRLGDIVISIKKPRRGVKRYHKECYLKLLH